MSYSKVNRDHNKLWQRSWIDLPDAAENLLLVWLDFVDRKTDRFSGESSDDLLKGLRAMGHANVQTTARYDRRGEKDQKEMAKSVRL